MDDVEFESHVWPLRHRLMRQARSWGLHDVADDVVSDTMTTLWRKALPPPTDAEQTRHLLALAITVLHGHARNRSRESRRLAALVAALADPAAQQVGEACDESYEWLQTTWLSVLPPQEQQLLRRRIEGYSIGEMAAASGCSYAAMAQRCTRAVRRLRSTLQDQDDVRDLA